MLLMPLLKKVGIWFGMYECLLLRTKTVDRATAWRHNIVILLELRDTCHLGGQDGWVAVSDER